MKRLVLFAVLVWMIAADRTHAQTKKPENKDLLPPPQEIPSIPLVPYVVPFYFDPPPRLGQRNVWELYSVNSRGQFVPRRAPMESVVPYYQPHPHNYYYVPGGQPYLPGPPFGSGALMPPAAD